MKHNKLYILALGMALAGTVSVNAQTQEKSYYTMDRLKADNPWSTSYNAAGLIFNKAEDYSVVEGQFSYQEGTYRNVSDPTGQNRESLFTESFRRLKNVYFYGKFDFDYSNRRNMGWSSLVHPYNTPIIIADSTPGSQRMESYGLSGGVGYPVGKHFAIGAKFDYNVVSNAKRKDARNTNSYMDLHIYPGVSYQTKYVRAGINFIYEKMTEKIDISIVGVGKTHTLYDFDGMWFCTSTAMQNGNTEMRDYKNNTLGGGLQLEFYGKEIRFFNQLAITERKQEIFRNNTGDDRNGEMKERKYKYSGLVSKTGTKYSHYLSMTANFTTQLGFDNIQQKQMIDGYNIWVQYGKKNKTVFDYINADVHYSVFRNRSAYNSSWNAVVGAKGFSIERAYRMYPVKFSQKMRNIEGYLSFDKNFQLKRGFWECGVSGSYAKGSGTLFEQGTISGDAEPDFSKYKQREDLRFQEYEYITADKFSAGFNACYTYFLNREKGTSLYANADVKYYKAVSGYYDGKEHTACEFKVGFAF